MPNKTIAIGVSIFAGLIILIMYQSLVVIPKEEIRSEEIKASAERKAKIFEEDRKERAYNSCINNAHGVYTADWNGQCELLGKEADCSLYPAQYTLIEERHKDAQDSCLVRFK